MNRILPLDIAPDLTLTIGGQSVQVSPDLGLRLAKSLAQVSAQVMVRETAERAFGAGERQARRAPRKVRA